MRFGASTWLWRAGFGPSDFALLERIRELGFDFVEIPVEGLDQFDSSALARALNSNGLGSVVCTVLTPERDLTADRKATRQAALDHVFRCLEIAAELGSDCLVGPLYSAVGKARWQDPARRALEWSRAVEGVRTMGERAAAGGLSIGLEPLNRFESDLVNTAAAALRLIGEAGEAGLGITLDNFHMHIEEADTRAAVETAVGKLVHVQVSDSHRGVPGSGSFDWAGFQAGLKRIGYTGRISIESFAPDVPELAGSVNLWAPRAPSQDAFAEQGLAFLRAWSATPQREPIPL